MLVFTTHNYFLFTRKEIWFYNGEPFAKGTYNVFSAAPKPLDTPTPFSEKYTTSIIDLSKTEEELFNAIHNTYRYDIRSAEKNKIEYRFISNPEKNVCKNLVIAYNEFAKEKDLPLMKFNRIEAIRKSGNLFITQALFNGNEVSTHVYIFDENVISLTNSFNNIHFTDSKIKGEANKWLHWKDILFFKEKQFKLYDFGGLNPKKLPGVNKFKMSFGGETIENYRFIESSSFLFFILEIIKKLRKK